MNDRVGGGTRLFMVNGNNDLFPLVSRGGNPYETAILAPYSLPVI